MRWLVLSLCLVACSNGTKAKHDDAPPISSQPDDARRTRSAAEGGAKVEETASAKVWLSSPQGEVPVTVEVVATAPKIMKGLMYREHLPIDHGMLFLMGVMNDGQEYDHAFYMRNTLIPLDMLFINKDLTVVGIVENAEPKTETLRRVGVPSLYVLEVNGGWTAKNQIKAGAKVRFDGVPPTPAP